MGKPQLERLSADPENPLETDLKSLIAQSVCGFDSRPRHQILLGNFIPSEQIDYNLAHGK